MTTPGPPNNRPPETPRGAPAGLPAVVTDSLLRQSARFSAVTGLVMYGLGGTHSLLSMTRFSGALFVGNLLTAVLLLSAATALGFGVHRSRLVGHAVPVLQAGLFALALLSGYWLMNGVPLGFPGGAVLYVLFTAPALTASALAAAAWLTERIQGPPTRQVPGVPADPYPALSTGFAVLLYAVVCLGAAILFILLDGGLDFDPTPVEPAPPSVLLGTLGLCLPFPLLMIGLALSLSTRARTTTPIFVTAVFAAIALLVSAPAAFVEFFAESPLHWALVPFLVAPLVWPIIRSWQGIPAERRRSWFGL
ncbi:hypothetical protein [Nocardiopsis metallicus]|uniref:Uncharacterized protein n=1 Tax=Nocardiopsis metallicus TaxID=179819 RepID=A0A840WQH1_9ACTN|nr:hypothetical protein [Nocardiopsis metallicus]MBB5495241.1 hypothetical protein [Nocardiopsis metallicus]